MISYPRTLVWDGFHFLRWIGSSDFNLRDEDSVCMCRCENFLIIKFILFQHFIGERKVDEDLSRTTRFLYDSDHLKEASRGLFDWFCLAHSANYFFMAFVYCFHYLIPIFLLVIFWQEINLFGEGEYTCL